MASKSNNAEGLTPIVSQQGDNEGLEGVYRRYKDGICRRVASKFGGGPPDPEDAVQAAFERYANLDDPGRVENPEAFLYRSANNFMLDHRRRVKVRTSHSDAEYSLADRTDDFDAERVLSAKERLAIVDRTIRAMDARRQEILIMNRIHGVSCAEIARHLNRSPTLVKILLAEAVILCQRALREAGDR